MRSHTLVFTLLLFSLTLMGCSISQNTMETKVEKFSIQGRITQSSQYCGGVAPTREQEMEYHTPKPYQTMLYVRKGKVNAENSSIYDSVMTDNEGHFQISLPPGDYVIILPSQREKTIVDKYLKMVNSELHADADCLKKWWENGLFQITVTDKDISALDHHFFNGCFVPAYIPCFNYTGPYPP